MKTPDSDAATLAANDGDSVTIDTRSCAREDTVAILSKRMENLPESVKETRAFPLGTYRGLTFGVVLHPFGGPEAFPEGASHRRADLRSNAGGRAL